MEKLDELFDSYKKVRQNQFELRGGAPPSATMAWSETDIVSESSDGHTIFSNEFLDRYSPDNIDINYFWKKATKLFKYYPIISVKNIKSIKHLNELSLTMHQKYLNVVDLYASNLGRTPLMLEIGPGYGSVKNYIKEKYGLNNYYAIDVNPLFKYKKLYKCDGKTIPENIPNKLDVVYSVNVFQHLSKNQRTSYYNQITNKLNSGGLFVFSMFAYDNNETKEHVYEYEDGKKKVFGTRDLNGNAYTSFFNQFTKIDNVYDVVDELNKIGFKEITFIRDAINHFRFLCLKEK